MVMELFRISLPLLLAMVLVGCAQQESPEAQPQDGDAAAEGEQTEVSAEEVREEINEATEAVSEYSEQETQKTLEQANRPKTGSAGSARPVARRSGRRRTRCNARWRNSKTPTAKRPPRWKTRRRKLPQPKPRSPKANPVDRSRAPGKNRKHRSEAARKHICVNAAPGPAIGRPSARDEARDEHPDADEHL